MRKIAVVGAGVMGAGIAAHIANAGVTVRLLDRPGIAAAALHRMRANPAPFMTPDAAALIATADSETELAAIADCDWIIEAVVERLDVKQALYRRIDAARRPDAAVSSNTSTFPLARLTEGQSEAFRRCFLVTHFFNPPRSMRLLELVAGAGSDPAVVARVAAFCDVALGKTPVACHDTPGFIANRIGAFWLWLGAVAAVDFGLSVELADAAMGRAAGIPRTGVFGLWDLIGLDVMAEIAASLRAALPATDPLRALPTDWPLLTRLIATGLTGRKGGGGFYLVERVDGVTTRRVLDLVTGEHRPEVAAEFSARDLAGLWGAEGAVGAYARRVLGETLAYAAALVPEAADDIVAVDTAMRLGYGWRRGPFEMIDALGADRVAGAIAAPPPLLAWRRPFHRTEGGRTRHLTPAGDYADSVTPPGILLLRDVRAGGREVLRGGSATLWDLGEGVAGLEFTSKLGSLDGAIMDLIGRAIAAVGEGFAALVIGHDGEAFSVGANLAIILEAARQARWGAIDDLLRAGQTAFKALKYAPFPVVAAPCGLTLGGGCEIVLHADAIQAHAETSMGLVECGVGLIPGWGGCGEMLERWREQPAEALFETLRLAVSSTSAAHARALRMLRAGDGITMNRDRLLADARAAALRLVPGYRPKAPPTFRLPGPAGCQALLATVVAEREAGRATAHDVTVAAGLARVLSGGEAAPGRAVSEAELLDLERREFLALIGAPATRARIEHTLATGKRLRN
jgi:3-hydroxyacyl-CoA dehydrogenase